MIYFAFYRELMGIAEETIELPKGLTVDGLIESVKSLHERLRGVGRMLVAVNGEFAKPGVRLREGDMVALFPPVSGG